MGGGETSNFMSTIKKNTEILTKNNHHNKNTAEN